MQVSVEAELCSAQCHLFALTRVLEIRGGGKWAP